ncbi:MAG: hypothetical protein M5U12_21065 [Verrucomicrobia bacterium]|nr:hypothetical protein [Verrucomicrobiota bacterium]
MSCFAYYSEPPTLFSGYAGPVVPAHLVYNGLGDPVGAIPLVAALAPLAAQLVGNLLRGDSSGGDGFGEYDDGLGLYADPELMPAQLVMNGLGEPVGAIPLIAALAPLAAKAAGFLAPLAAKAAGALVPLASKAASAIVPLAAKAAGSVGPLLQNVASQALPALTSALPGLLPRGPAPVPPRPRFRGRARGPGRARAAPRASVRPCAAAGARGPFPGAFPAFLRRRRRPRWGRMVRRGPRLSRGSLPGPVAPDAPPPLPPPPPSPMPAPATAASGGWQGTSAGRWRGRSPAPAVEACMPSAVVPSEAFARSTLT